MAVMYLTEDNYIAVGNLQQCHYFFRSIDYLTSSV